MSKKKTLSKKQIFLINVFVGNIDNDDIKDYIEDFKNNFKTLNDYEDAVVLYVPVRNENLPAIIKIQ